MKRIAHDGVLLNRCDPGIRGTPTHQHLFDVTPLLEQEFVLHAVGVIRESNIVGKMLDSIPNHGQE